MHVIREFFWRFDFEIKVLLFLALFALVFYFLGVKTAGEAPLITNLPEESEKVSERDEDCGKECQAFVRNLVDEAIATLSGKTVKTQIVGQRKSQANTTYIPLSGVFSTKQRDWADTGSEIYLVKSDYSKDAYFNWDAFIRTSYGGGEVKVRLFDVTHGIAVDGSELSAASQSSTQVSSEGLNLWSGRNLYRVQIKSLNGYEVFFDSGRIKVYEK